MNITFSYDSSVSNAPAEFKTALDYAAAEIGALITSPGTVNLEVGYGDIMHQAMGAGDLGEGGPSGAGTVMSYENLVAVLKANATTADDRKALAALPASPPTNIPSYFIASAQLKAWGMLPQVTPGIDGVMGFSATNPFSYDPNNRAVPGKSDFIGVAEHEITHALGRIYSDGPLELVNFSAPHVFANPNTGGYFSLDGGVTNLANFAAAPGDTADWQGNGETPHNSFDYITLPGLTGIMPTVDKQMLDVLGFNLSKNAPTHFAVVDTTTNVGNYQDGVAYAGPVAGLTSELILANSDNINVTAYTSGVFIHTGAGNDAVDATLSGGSNVIDGGRGSNFLSGGTGKNTYFVDDRDPGANIWSTVVGLHAGDEATIWGVDQAGFGITWADNQGSQGASGLTGSFAAAGRADVNLTLAGYTQADIGTRLNVVFGHTADLPGLAGSSYMQIQAV